MENYTITKSTVECYKIRHPKLLYWADITVDHNGSKGRIQIASDFGDYQYYWGACGCSFKEFLCKIGIDYAACKFGADRCFDSEATITSYKETIIQYRRCGNLSDVEARKLFNEIKNLEDTSSENEFCAHLSHTNTLMDFFDWHPTLVRTITPQFKKFWNQIWPIFTTQLKNEIEPVCSS